MLKRLIAVTFLLLAVTCLCAAQPADEKLKSYYESLRDGLSVSDLEHFRPLNEVEQRIAETLLLTHTNAASSNYHECCSNLKNYGTALEMWSVDHQGQFPQDGEVVHPYYLAFGIACPNSDRKPYGYELKEGVYYIRCAGDHSDYGVEPPLYNGTSGLANYVKPEDAPNPPWKLKEYTITELTNEFDDQVIFRIAETWSNGNSDRTFNSQISPLLENGNLILSRPVALTQENIRVTESSDAINKLVARLQPTPLASDEEVVESFQALGPALTGITVMKFLDDEELTESRVRLLKMLDAEE